MILRSFCLVCMAVVLVACSSGILSAQEDGSLMELTHFEILQVSVDIRSEASSVAVVAEARSGAEPLQGIRVQFASSLGEAVVSGELSIASGQEGVWEGTVEFPQSLTCGTWEARCTVELEDAAGNAVSISPAQLDAKGFDAGLQVISQEDTTQPTITLNGSPEMTLECGVDSYSEPGAAVWDNCCAETPAIISGDVVNTQETGTYVVAYNAADCHGNQAIQATRTVRVVDLVRLNGPAEMLLECGVDSYNELGATVSDSCCAEAPVVIGGDVVNTLETGTYVVTYRAIDCRGNEAVQATRTVRVAEIVRLNGPAEVTLECGVDAYVELGASVGNCCCAGPVTLSGTVDTATPGTYTVTYNAEDCRGNAAIPATRTVHVVDTIPPVITCPNDVWQDNDPGVCTASLDPGMATATDHCPVDVTATRSDDLALDDPYPIGITAILWFATDSSGNSTSCIQTVEVKDSERIAENDTEPPVITCPGDIVSACSSESCGARVDLGKPKATDNCWATVRGSRSDGLPLGRRYPLGRTTITWEASDPAGNTATCTQTVTVVDREPPTITCPPEPAPVTTDRGECFASATRVALGAPTATDNCGDPTVSHDAPAQFPVGDTLVTWTATDAAGNTAVSYTHLTLPTN